MPHRKLLHYYFQIIIYLQIYFKYISYFTKPSLALPELHLPEFRRIKTGSVFKKKIYKV